MDENENTTPGPDEAPGQGTGPDDQQHLDVADDDELADEMSEESFPNSDPPASWAGSDDPSI